MADFVACRGRLGPLQSVPILGAPGTAAGAFRELQSIVRERVPRAPAFAPSTRILDVVPYREMANFWAGVRRLNPARVPERRFDNPLPIFPTKLSIVISVVLAILAFHYVTYGYVVPTSVLAYLIGFHLTSFVATYVADRVFNRLCDRSRLLFEPYRDASARLPDTIATFGDLARLIAGERGGWCHGCGYDLTGITEFRCPECGRDPRILQGPDAITTAHGAIEKQSTDDVPPPHPVATRDDLLDLLRELPGAPATVNGTTRIDALIPDPIGTGASQMEALYRRIESRFEISLSDVDRNYLSGCRLCKTRDDWAMRFAPLFHVDRLASLVLFRAEVDRIGPITAPDIKSETAGAFRVIERLVAEVAPHIDSFGPDTPIAERLNGRKLARFWRKLYWRYSLRIPPPATDIPSTLWGLRLTSWFALGSLVVAFVLALAHVTRTGSGLSGNSVGWIGATVAETFLLFLLMCLPTLAVHWLWRRGRSVARRASRLLPPDILTFGDLADLLAGIREGWCEGCGYELTGVVSEHCPECGRSLPR